MTVLRVRSTLALAGLVQALTPGFEAAEILRVHADFQPTAVLMPQLRAAGGERGDVVLLTAEGIGALAAEGVVVADSVVALARSFVGVAVKAGAARPDISTHEAFVAALLGAESVGLSRQGASGLFVAGLLRRLGILEAVMKKAVVIESGFTGELAANGVVALALQQVSELMVVPGVEIVGRLPEAFGGATVFSGGVVAGSRMQEAGEALLREMSGAGAVMRTLGLEEV